MRLLFCMASDGVSGGHKVFRHWMRLLSEDGNEVFCFTWDKRKQFDGWSDNSIPELRSLADVASTELDFVVFSNSFLIPLIVPHIGSAHPILMAMAYESFHYGNTFAEAMQDKSAFLKILNLPISVMTVSKPLQQLMLERAGINSYYVPHAIESHFSPRPIPSFEQIPKRVLMVGNYLLPWKGMKAGFDAIQEIAKEIDVQLVLLTQSNANRDLFEKYSFPIEFHHQPDLSLIPDIYATCHAFLCSSWHEGFGMPALECMKIGIPVVSTDNDGINEFAFDGVNVLLAATNNTADLHQKLRSVLTDYDLYLKLKAGGLKTNKPYSWSYCLSLFNDALSDIERTHNRPAPDTPAPDTPAPDTPAPDTPAPDRPAHDKPAHDRPAHDKPAVFDKQVLEQLLRELEEEGLYTPRDTYSMLASVLRNVDDLCEKLSAKSINAEQTLTAARVLRAEIKPFIQEENVESYAAFRAPYDFCGLLIGMIADNDFVEKASLMSQRRLSNVSSRTTRAAT